MRDNINYENYKEVSEEVLQSLQKEYLEPQMSEEQLNRLKTKMEVAKRENRKDRNRTRVTRLATTAAALVIAFIALPNMSPTIAYAMEKIPVIGQFVKVVTFRDYEYTSDRNIADIEVPEIKLEETLEDSKASEKLKRTTDEINVEIQEITNELVEHFEKHLEDEQGYQEIIVKSNVLATTQDYFTLKLFCYQGAGSGYQWNYYFSIDLNTGERLQMQDVFKDGADYITPISENIKEQMQAQMAEDEMVCYWLDQEIEECNFKTITDETAFYLNESGNVVICFNEGDVAPMYMGAVEFEIPAEVLENIRK